MKDCKGNDVFVGKRLTTLGNIKGTALIECIDISDGILKMMWLTISHRKTFIIDKESLASSAWVVV